MGKKWLPLESNPVVLNEFCKTLGLETSQYSFHDVYGLDPVEAPPNFPAMPKNIDA
jgi:ubiquitin carboxyl-terminal hydrolase L3